MRMLTEKQIKEFEKEFEAEIEIEKTNTIYKDENFILVKAANLYYIRNLTGYPFNIDMQDPYEHIHVNACSLVWFGSERTGEQIVKKIMAHEFDIVHTNI